MKVLFTEMTDPVNMFHENEELDYVRQQAWHDAVAGMYAPEGYTGEARRAYDIGRQQIEEFCHEEGIDLFNKEPEVEVLIPTLEEELRDPHNEWGTWGKGWEKSE
jgi:hypothetical protein